MSRHQYHDSRATLKMDIEFLGVILLCWVALIKSSQSIHELWLYQNSLTAAHTACVRDERNCIPHPEESVLRGLALPGLGHQRLQLLSETDVGGGQERPERGRLSMTGGTFMRRL